MKIVRYKETCDSLELYDVEIQDTVINDEVCAEEELVKLHKYYNRTGSYDVGDIEFDSYGEDDPKIGYFTLMDYETRDEYVVKIEN